MNRNTIKEPAQAAYSPVKKKFEDKAAPKPEPDSPKPWRQRRSAAERKADGSYKPRAEAAEAEDVTYGGLSYDSPSQLVAKAPPFMADPPSREGTVAITAHLPPEVRERLKVLAARQRRTMNELIAEALEDLFRKYGEREKKSVDHP